MYEARSTKSGEVLYRGTANEMEHFELCNGMYVFGVDYVIVNAEDQE